MPPRFLPLPSSLPRSHSPSSIHPRWTYTYAQISRLALCRDFFSPRPLRERNIITTSGVAQLFMGTLFTPAVMSRLRARVWELEERKREGASVMSLWRRGRVTLRFSCVCIERRLKSQLDFTETPHAQIFFDSSASHSRCLYGILEIPTKLWSIKWVFPGNFKFALDKVQWTHW